MPEDHGSSMRTMNFVRFFQHYGTVDIAYSLEPSNGQGENSPFSSTFYFEHKGASKSIKRRFMDGFIKGVPVPVCDFGIDSQRFLLKLIKDNDYDYILIRYTSNAKAFFKIEKKYRTRIIIDFDDILSGSLYESKFGSVKGWHKNIVLGLNRKLLKHYEKKCLNFGAALFCSERDRLDMDDMLQYPTFVVPNIYINKSFENYDFEDGFNKGNILLFVGALNYLPNNNGLTWFIKFIFSDFKKEYPDAKLLVVGRSPNNDIKEICESREEIELYSDVPDVKEYYNQCRAVVVPLLEGSGTRIKILEAALANTPVLSTPKGAQGLELVDERDVLLFENSRKFCAKYSTTLDKNMYNLLTMNAKDAVLTRYSVQRFNDAMKHVLLEMEYKK